MIKMRKTSLITSRSKKCNLCDVKMCHAELINLDNIQYEKLTEEYFANQIDSIAKDLHVDWAVEKDANGQNIISISRTTTDDIDDTFCLDLEVAAANFMSAIDNLQYEVPCPAHEEAETEEEIKFVECMLKDIENPEVEECKVIGADIICHGPSFIPFPIHWGRMSGVLLKEMCELYLAAHHK